MSVTPNRSHRHITDQIMKKERDQVQTSSAAGSLCLTVVNFHVSESITVTKLG